MSCPTDSGGLYSTIKGRLLQRDWQAVVSLLSQAFWVEMKNEISAVSCDGAGLQLWFL